MRDTTRRAFNANPPPGEYRCCADIPLRDGTGAQCMRRAKDGAYCKQHTAIRAREAREAEERRMADRDLRDLVAGRRPAGRTSRAPFTHR